MANPVNNGGINAKININLPTGKGVEAGGSAKVSVRQTTDAIRGINQNYTKNPNHTRTVEIAGDADAKTKTQSKAGDLAAPPKTQNQNQTERGTPTAKKGQPERGEDGTLVNRPNRGEQGKTNASETGLEKGRGHQKTANQNQTPPIIANPNERGDGEHRGQTRQNQTPPIFTPNEPHGQDHQPNFGEHYSVKYNLRANGNQPNGLIRNVVSQILRQNH